MNPSGAPAILLVDDDVRLLRALKGTLEKRRYSVIATSDPDFAVTTAATAKVAVALLDQDLSRTDIDGLGLLATIKETQPNIEIIFITGYNSAALAVQAMKGGAADF